jgi:hypothetical protein
MKDLRWLLAGTAIGLAALAPGVALAEQEQSYDQIGGTWRVRR